MAKPMGSGISNIIRHGIVKTLYSLFLNWRTLNSNQGKKIRLSFGCNIKNTQLGKHVFVGRHSFIRNSKVGDHSYISEYGHIRDTEIGKFCSIGPGVQIVIGRHPTNLVSTHPAFYSVGKPFITFAKNLTYSEYEKVVIGNDVWIGQEVLIPGGIKIGDGAIIAARAVVTQDVAPYAIVGGVPAKLIRYRFDADTIDHLQSSEWWNKDENWLRKNYLHFHNIAKFNEIITRPE